jgi:hypothetical protein
MWVGLPLRLEPHPAVLRASVPMATVALRILFEERFLRREVKGYPPSVILRPPFLGGRRIPAVSLHGQS